MDREQLIAEREDKKTRRAVLGTFDDGWDDFNTSERRRFEAMDEANLRKAILSAHKEINGTGGELARRRFAIVREVFGERANWLLAGVGEVNTQLHRNIPPVLTAAIARMEKALEFAQSLGRTQFMFGSIPGGEVHTSAIRPAHGEVVFKSESAGLEVSCIYR